MPGPHAGRHRPAEQPPPTPSPCREPHTAETFLVDKFTGRLPPWTTTIPPSGRERVHRVHPAVQAVHRRRREPRAAHVLSWAWFRPTRGRVGRGRALVPLRRRRRRRGLRELSSLPHDHAQGMLLGIPGDPWMACVDAAAVAGRSSSRLHASKHPWRAVTTIVVGEREGRLPRRPARRGAQPRLLLGLGRRVDELPHRLRLRATPGSTRPSGRPATGGRSAGRGPTE